MHTPKTRGRVSVPTLFRTSFALCTTLALVAQTGHAAESRVRLAYARKPGAEVCQDESSFRTQLTAKLGYEAITTEEGTRVLRVTFTRRAGGFRGLLELRDAAGKILGSRSLDSNERDCRELLSALVVAAAISVDPSSIAGGPRVPRDQGKTDRTRNAASDAEPIRTNRATTYIAVDAAILLALGTEPGPTVGGTLGVALGRHPWSLKGELRLDASTSTKTISTSPTPRFSGISGTLFGGTVVPCYQTGFLRGCAALLLGGLSLTGGSTTSLTSTTRFFAAAGPRVEAALPIGRAAGLFLRAELLINLIRTDAFVDGVSMWHVPPVSGSIGIGGDLQFALKDATR